MRATLLLALAVLGPTMTLACRETEDPIIVYVEPRSDASSPFARVLAEDESEIPCAPRRVLQTVCQRCHMSPMQNGAPFPLVNRSDVVERTYGNRVVRDVMLEEVKAGRMPLRPVEIGIEDKEVLIRWLEDGAPAVPSDTCLDAGADARSEVENAGNVDADAFTDADAKAEDANQ